MPIVLPLYVKMRNARLQVCATCMNISVFCGVIAQFMYFGQYGKPVKVSGGVSLWNPSVQNFSVIEALEKQKTFDAFCASRGPSTIGMMMQGHFPLSTTRAYQSANHTQMQANV